MDRAHIIVDNDVRRRLKRQQQLANQIMFARERAFWDVAHIALPSSLYMPPVCNGQQAILVDGDSALFNPDRNP